MTLDPRLFKGSEQTAAPHFLKKWPRELLLWALDIKIGDYFASCEGCNRKITAKELVYVEAHQYTPQPELGDYDDGRGWNFEDKETQILHEVIFTDNRGRWHHCPGGGCALPQETPEEVTAYHREWAFDDKYPESAKKWHGKNAESYEKAIAGWERMQEAFRAKRPIVDEFGELLPEFESKVKESDD